MPWRCAMEPEASEGDEMREGLREDISRVPEDGQKSAVLLLKEVPVGGRGSRDGAGLGC